MGVRRARSLQSNAQKAAQRKAEMDQPSRPEKAAQRWHEEQHTGGGFGKCWCCCSACVYVNPHWINAKRAAWADIVARIRDSVAAIRPPGKRHR